MASTTRIADLPENITMSMHAPQAQQGGVLPSINTRVQPEEQNITYTQMNVHPNPYGNPPQPQLMALPQHTAQSQHNPFLPQQTGEQYLPPQHRLPSRDIPQDTHEYTHDEAIQANYIPKPKLTSDYIRDYEEDEEVELRNHKQKKRKERLMDTLFTEFQIPIFVAILFFIFQMPIVNTLLYKRFSFLSIYSADGNFNFYGLFLKSAVFGLSYYSLSRTVDYISSI
jgi:hypothetical protein